MSPDPRVFWLILKALVILLRRTYNLQAQMPAVDLTYTSEGDPLAREIEAFIGAHKEATPSERQRARESLSK